MSKRKGSDVQGRDYAELTRQWFPSDFKRSLATSDVPTATRRKIDAIIDAGNAQPTMPKAGPDASDHFGAVVEEDDAGSPDHVFHALVARLGIAASDARCLLTMYDNGSRNHYVAGYVKGKAVGARQARREAKLTGDISRTAKGAQTKAIKNRSGDRHQALRDFECLRPRGKRTIADYVGRHGGEMADYLSQRGMTFPTDKASREKVFGKALKT